MAGLTLECWGPSFWNVMHVVSHTFSKNPSEAERAELRQLFTLLISSVPCTTCKQDALSYLEAHMDDDCFRSRETVVEFMNDFHNYVNEKLGKRVYSLDEHYYVYRRVVRRRKASPAHVLFALVLLVLAAAAVRAKRRQGGLCA